MTKKKGMFSWFGKKSVAETKPEVSKAEKEALLKSLKDEALKNEDENVEIILFDDVDERADEEKLKADKLAAEKLQAEKLQAEKLQVEQLQAEQLEAEKLQAEKLQAEQLQAEKLQAEKLQAEKLQAEKLQAEKLQAEKLQAEQLQAEQLQAEQLQAEQLQAEQLQAEQLQVEKLEAETTESAGEEYYEEIMFEENIPAVVDEPVKKEKSLGFFARFKQSLTKTRLSIGSGLFSLFKGKKIDDELFEELEEQLIVADIGVDTTLKIIDNLTEQADRKQLKDADALYGLLKDELSNILEEVEKPLVVDKTKSPYVILMVGVNGVGKTTTIGKLAKQYQQQGKSVMLAAGDTFRAAAVEQLQVWGERNDIPVIAQQTGADSASVLFDAMDAAKARGADILIADTAGRLQNKDHLMDELSKVVRIMRKKDETAPHEIMLTIDAGTGQNAISQVNLFNQAVGLTGITLTKLDGTAKGGIIFSIADKFKLPIRYIGTGEGIDDLREFNAKEFIDALFSKEEDSEDEN
ncbi:signal recognition particle-docking protein FtsY [Psychromonas sp. psych-6C06]|uniref:signal recognition particle-docking protein FtsY n=1 Tax=Psychromonas sp. psych-6C06 TaxID=2058089 RepID=UPI000C33A42C|nr:signal recognition particle-docking protein FtsY [Psychromonas sp. psych-6C06]PKF61934.1 signal recognition particle-docking protein FtsY [Psychromonas sp. psych-6C06]